MINKHENLLTLEIELASSGQMVIVFIDGIQYAAVQEDCLEHALKEGFVPSDKTYVADSYKWIMGIVIELKKEEKM